MWKSEVWSIILSIHTILPVLPNCKVRKRIFEHIHPAEIQISLRTRTVWSESSLSAFWIAKDAIFLRADNKDCPANTQRRYNVAATSHRCSDVVTTLLLRCVFAEWSDCADAQADLSLRQGALPKVRFLTLRLKSKGAIRNSYAQEGKLVLIIQTLALLFSFNP